MTPLDDLYVFIAQNLRHGKMRVQTMWNPDINLSRRARDVKIGRSILILWMRTYKECPASDPRLQWLFKRLTSRS